MSKPLSKYLFQATGVATGAQAATIEAAVARARECEQSGADYPAAVWDTAQTAYRLLQESAPEVIAEYGPLPDRP